MFFDGHSTSPLAPEVRDAVMSAWEHSANPHSHNVAGASAALLIDNAREAVANLIGASDTEIVFTSGATEANNLAILGVARSRQKSSRSRILISAIEHKAVTEPARALEQEGFEVVKIPVDVCGVIAIDALNKELDERTLMVSVMAANNETGVVQPVERIAAAVRRVGALLHCDAAQAVGKIPIDVGDLDVDYMSISAHKMYGPFGVGALFISSDAPDPVPLMFGGGQQRGVRPGTLGTPLVVGLGVACELAGGRLAADAEHSSRLRECFIDGLRAVGIRFQIVGDDASRLPGSLAILLHDVDAESLVDRMGAAVALSTGAACTSGMAGPSHVLAAMGISPTLAKSFVRMYFGRYNTSTEVAAAVDAFRRALLN